MKWIYTLLVVVFLVSFYFFYQTFPDNSVAVSYKEDIFSDDTLTVLLSGSRVEWDPYQLSYEDNIFLINQVFQGLVKLDENLLVVPDLAYRWEISEDKKIFRFFLKPNQVFHNGDPLTVDDVIASLKHYFKYYSDDYFQKFLYIIAGSREFSKGEVDTIRGLKKISNVELEVELLHPYLPFLKLMTLPETKVLPGRYLKSKKLQWQGNPIGSGPYKVSAMTDDFILLEAFQWPPRDEFSPRIKFIQLFLNWNQISERFRNKNFDISFIYDDSLFLSQKDWRIKTVKSVWQSYLGMNCQKFPTNNVLFRKALTSAVDKEKFAAGYAPLSEPSVFLSPFNLPREIPSKPGVKPDADEIKRLLQAFKEENGLEKIPTISFLADTINNYFEDYQIIKKQLEKAGIPVKINFYHPDKIDKTEERKLVQKNNLYLLSWNLDLPDPEFFFYTFFYSRSLMNWSGYSSPTVDSLIQAAHDLTSIKDRLKVYEQVEEILNREIPEISLLTHKDFVIYKNYVQGIKLNKLGVRSLNLSRLYFNKTRVSQRETNKNEQRN